MSKKNISLIALVVVLAGVYICFFTDWFASENIQIYHTVRPARPDADPRKNSFEQRSAGNPVVFGLNRTYELTAVKVVSVSDAETNKYPHAIWHLVSESNSVPLKSFTYGQRIRGMKPKIEGSQPEPLVPGAQYRLFLEAGALTGEHDFATTPKRILR